MKSHLRLASVFAAAFILVTSHVLVATSRFQSAVDVVFDLDGTLFYSTTAELAASDPAGTMVVDQKFYRFTDHVVEVLVELYSQPGIRISFFSGGPAERNQQLIKILYERLHQKLPGILPYKVLSFEDLKVVSNDPTLSFCHRYKKDLSPYFDLSTTVLVDDNAEFAMPGQEKNLLWLGKVYRDLPHYELTAQLRAMGGSAQDQLPSNQSEWQRERDKLLPVAKIITKAVQKMATDQFTFVQNLTALQLPMPSCSSLFSPTP